MPEVFPLSPIEHVFTGTGGYPITMRFVYERPLDADALRAGLAAAVRELPWVGGRLCAADEQTWGVACVPELELESADELLPVETRVGEPVARLNVSTDRRCLHASISHALVDGSSYFQFLSTWARLTRGDRVLAASREPLPTSTHDGVVSAEDVLARCGLAWDEAPRAGPLPRELRVAIGKAELDAQRQSGLFDNDIIAARLWQEHGREEDGESLLSVPIDLRPLLRARRYFGCAVGFVTVRLPFDELRSLSVIDVARRVRAAVASFNKDAAMASLGVLEQLRRQEGRAVVEQLHVRHPRAGLIVTNLTRVPVRDLDFGTGPPVDFSARAQIDYSVALFPAEDGVDARVYMPG